MMPEGGCWLLRAARLSAERCPRPYRTDKGGLADINVAIDIAEGRAGSCECASRGGPVAPGDLGLAALRPPAAQWRPGFRSPEAEARRPGCLKPRNSAAFWIPSRSLLTLLIPSPLRRLIRGLQMIEPVS